MAFITYLGAGHLDGPSDSGGKQVVSNRDGQWRDGQWRDGRWEARVEFRAAPLNESFMVMVTSSKGEAVYGFPLERVDPG